MTLITYSTRVHFAEGILEEAIWSEVEAKGRKRPLIIGAAGAAATAGISETHERGHNELFERIMSGLPAKSEPRFYSDLPRIPNEATVRTIAKTFRDASADVIIAFGGATAIDLAKLARFSLRAGPRALDHFTHFEGIAATRSPLPDLIAIPDTRGLGSAVSAYAPIRLANGTAQRIINSDLIPDVTICDPSIASEVAAGDRASAVSEALARCLEAFLSPGYNPPAAGIASDGLKRIVNVLARHSRVANRETDRDVMAASLNGALALQKDVGATHALAMVLRMVADRDLDPGAVCRILLPRMIELYEARDSVKAAQACRTAGFGENASLADGLLPLLDALPLPSRLSELGVRKTDIVEAARVAETEFVGRGRDLAARPGQLAAMMTSVH
ncbi:MAG: iron-containing alcohol dehydrogenase [Pseudomonadota bacterium]